MEEGKPSRTATIAAINRAAHLFLDDDPKILNDSFALGLSGLPNEDAIRDILNKIELDTTQQFGPRIASAIWRGYRGSVVVRSRYTEDALNTSVKNGVNQYVILGAGLDSYAYRKRDNDNSLRIFEVDHPASQLWKKSRLKELNIPIPSNLTFVPLDLEKQTLLESLIQCGFKTHQAAFFSLLGVMPYLSEESIFEIMKMVSHSPSGTVIVFEYVLLDSLLDEETKTIINWIKKKSSAFGEPWISQFDPEVLKERLKQIGFSRISDFGPSEAHTSYFANRKDQLASAAELGVFIFAHLMKAQVD